jgi:voltage-gated potassium channel Kch
MRIHLPGIKTFILGQYGSLLTVLVLLILLQPSVNTTVGKYVLEGLFVAALLSGLRAVDIKRTLFRFLVVLLLCSLGLSVLGIVFDSIDLLAMAIAGRGVFMALVAIAILYDLFRARSVTGDTLAGAVCVYLLIATTWSYGYLLVEYINPESFSFTQAHGRMEMWLSKEFYPFIYFSLVTMTTVGYGDMSPVSAEARTLATMEAIVGQIYLTILVARLVGMHLVHQQGKAELTDRSGSGSD